MPEMNYHEEVAEKFRQKVEEERQKTAAEMAARAKYKIQIFFTSKRTDRGPISFSISVWESGKRLHGGGDECMFVCKRQVSAAPRAPFGVMGAKVVNPDGCGGFIPGDLVQGLVVCPHCGLKWASNEIGDSIFYRLSAGQAAEVLEKIWLQLEGNADLYAKYRPDDIRVTTMRQAEGLRRARELKGMTIYPLKNIIKDTTNGTPIASRFKAFILA